MTVARSKADGSFGFEQGHALVLDHDARERHPLYAQRALAARIGATRADWMMRTASFLTCSQCSSRPLRGPADAIARSA